MYFNRCGFISPIWSIALPILTSRFSYRLQDTIESPKLKVKEKKKIKEYFRDVNDNFIGKS